MSIISAYLLPHPPLAIPAVGRGDEKTIRKTITAIESVADEIAKLAPEVIIYITPHSNVYRDYFHISPGEGAAGDFARFGAADCGLSLHYTPELAEALIKIAQKEQIPAGYDGERDAALDHGVLIPAWYIHRRYTNYTALRIAPSGLDMPAHYRFGQSIAQAAALSGRKTVVIASGDLSHKLSERGPYGYAPQGEVYDQFITQRVCKAGKFNTLFEEETLTLREKAAECAHGCLAILAGCLHDATTKNDLLSYEGPFGVGYAVARFVTRFAEEDPYRRLARLSLEHAVKTNTTLPIPEQLPTEMYNTRAGAFVSIHKHGRLRGCIGTIFPATKSLAAEIIQNAVSAGLSDLRFDAVTKDELDDLVYKVDILAAPEKIDGLHQLDVKRYGVIVSAGQKRGLLLPNLEGIDTVEQQIAIACQKAGIANHETITLERFEVTRYE